MTTKTITIEVFVTQGDMLVETWASILGAVNDQLENATRDGPDPFDSFPSCSWRFEVEEDGIAELKEKIKEIVKGRSSSVSFSDESGEYL